MVKNLYYVTLILVLCVSNILSQNSYLTITSPVNDEILLAGEKYLITWTSLNVSNIKIEFSENNGKDWVEITFGPAIPNRFNWKTPSINTSEALIRISDFNKNQSIVNFVISDIPSRELLTNQIFKNKSNIQSEPIKIMPLGNSITKGSAGSPNKIGYRRSLYLSLTNLGYNIDFVGTQMLGLLSDFDIDHEGHSGWHAGYPQDTSISISNNIKEWLQLLSPDIVLLHIGTNDIISLESSGEDIRVTVSEVKDILDSIKAYEFIAEKDVIVFLAQIINRLDDENTSSVNEADTTSAFNILIKDLTDSLIAEGEKIVLVNHEDNLIYPDDLFDGIHPNQIGYDKMANAWLEALLPVLGEKPSIILQPQTIGVIEGDTVTFFIEAVGSNFLNYQWFKNDLPIVGEIYNNFTINHASIEDNNSTYYCQVSNLIGNVISDTVKLFVTDSNQRVSGGQIVYYDFEENNGDIIYDKSGVGEVLNLIINDTDSVSWITSGIKINSPTIIYSNSSANKIYEACALTNEISIEAWISPNSLNQSGPARIITMSEDALNRNFTISQNLSTFNNRLRTTSTNNNGSPYLNTADSTFVVGLSHIVYVHDNLGNSKMYINGIEKGHLLLPGNFSNWDSTYKFLLANEFVDNRAWLGNIYSVAVYNRALNGKEIYHNYNIGIEGVTNIIAPSQLNAFHLDSNTIKLSWNDDYNIGVEYIIERSNNNPYDFYYLDSVKSGISNFLDSNIVDGNSYYYRMKAFNDFFESNYSNLDSVKIELYAPRELAGSLNPENFVELTWVDKSKNELGFIIEAKPNHPDSTYKIIDTVNSNIMFYEDRKPKFFTPYEYRIYAFKENEISTFSNSITLNVVGIIKENTKVPTEFSLFQNYPNPFNPMTIISFAIPIKSRVKLNIYNSLGQLVKNLVDEELSEGLYEINFNSDHITSGVYFYSLEAIASNMTKKLKFTKKMILQK